MVEVQLITCPHCKGDALAGSQRLRLDGQLGCVHCGEPFNLGSAQVKTMTFDPELGGSAWGGFTRERRQRGRPLLSKP
jgi:hypothetical protein